MPSMAALPTVPAVARTFVRTTLPAWHLKSLTESAELVASELASNAVSASTDSSGRPVYVDGRMPVVHMCLLTDGLRLVLEVWDQAPGVPVLQDASEDEESGRGLLLVDAIADKWGWCPTTEPGKVVWAECALEAPDCIPGSAGRNSEDIPGSLAYPAPKGKGDCSMPLKRRPVSGIRDGVPRDPRNMVKARLPEPQSPVD